MNYVQLYRYILFIALTLCCSVGPALAQLDTTAIPFAPNGSGGRDGYGAPVQLTETSFLVPASGPDFVVSADEM